MTAVDRPDNGQDEGRELLDKATGLVAHNVSPAVGWWRSADAKGEPFDRELLHERYERAARDVLALASGHSGGEQQQERVARWLFAHDGSTPSAWDRLLNDAGKRVWLRYADELLTLLDRTQPDDDPGPQCPSTSHDTDGGWRCEHRAGHDPKVKHKNREKEW